MDDEMTRLLPAYPQPGPGKPPAGRGQPGPEAGASPAQAPAIRVGLSRTTGMAEIHDARI